MILSRINPIFSSYSGASTQAKPSGSLGGSGKHGRLKIYTHILSYRFKSDSEYMHCEPVLLVTTSTSTNLFKYLYANTMLFFNKIYILLNLCLIFSRAILQFKGSWFVFQRTNIAKRCWDIAVTWLLILNRSIFAYSFNYLAYTLVYMYLYLKSLSLYSILRSFFIFRIRALEHCIYTIGSHAFQ